VERYPGSKEFLPQSLSMLCAVLGHDAAHGKIMDEIGGPVGPKSAAAIQDMLKGAGSRPSKGIVASIIGIVTLIAGASGVLSELKSALNTIWRTQEPGNVKELIKKNALFLGMLLGIGFLMTVSLILSAALASLGKFLTGFLPAPEIVLHGIDFIFSAGSSRFSLPPCTDSCLIQESNGGMYGSGPQLLRCFSLSVRFHCR